MQDINIFAPVVLTQIAALVGPDLRSTASNAMIILADAFGTDWFTKDYYNVMLTHIKNKVQSNPKRRYYLTGHSLGAGLAQLAALEVGHVAVTFAPPGLKMTAPMMLPSHLFRNSTQLENAADT